jgi:hypothetical protein
MVFDFGVSKSGLLKILKLTSDALGKTDTQIITNKQFDAALNSLIQTTPGLGAIFVDNGTKFVARARPAAHLPLKGNPAGTDIEYAKLDVPGGGTGQVTLPTGTVLIGAGTSGITTKANPAGAFLGDSDVQNNTGKKSFFNTTFAQRNPANTFTGTLLNPRITADANLEYGYTGYGLYVAYRDSVGSYVSKDLTTHAIAYSGAVAETAIQTAITNAGQYGTVFLVGVNPFTLSAGFTGFDVLYHQTIQMGAGTKINVPPGYTGSMFKFSGPTNSCAHAKLFGGLLSEQTPLSNLWTAIDIDSNATTKAYDIRVSGTRIFGADRGIKIRTDTTGWSNGDTFDNMYIEGCVVGIEFIHTGTFTTAASGGNTNHFGPMTIQAGTPSTYGIKDVNGRRNTFLNCYVVDFSGADIGCNITANAEHTEILGGTVTALNFADLSPAGKESFIRDEYQGDIAKTRKTWSYEDSVAISAPASPSTGTVIRYLKIIDANND